TGGFFCSLFFLVDIRACGLFFPQYGQRHSFRQTFLRLLLPDDRSSGVNRNACQRGAYRKPANLVRGQFHAGTRNVEAGQAPVEWGHPVKEVAFRTTEAWMSRLYRKAASLIPLYDGTGSKGRRTFAADFVKTVAFPGVFIIELHDELPGIVMSASRALVVDSLSIGKNRSPVLVELWRMSIDHVIEKCSRDHLTDWWTAGHINHRTVFYDTRDADSSGGIR